MMENIQLPSRGKIVTYILSITVQKALFCTKALSVQKALFLIQTGREKHFCLPFFILNFQSCEWKPLRLSNSEDEVGAVKWV